MNNPFRKILGLFQKTDSRDNSKSSSGTRKRSGISPALESGKQTGLKSKPSSPPRYITLGSELGFRILEKHVDSANQINPVVSPVGLAMAMTLLHEGVDDTTRSEIAAALEAINYSHPLHELVQLLSERMKNENAEEKNLLKIANAIFVDQDYSVSEEYSSRLNQLFDAHIESLKFGTEQGTASMNSWVGEKTGNLINNLVDKTGDLDKLFLINVIYFLGKWNSPFKDEETHEAEFENMDRSKSKVRKMFQKNVFPYYEDKQLQFAAIPYLNSEFELLVVLPKKTKEILPILKSLGKEKIHEIGRLSKEKELNFYLPKFKIEVSQQLENILRSLGVERIFSGQSSFDTMSQGEGLVVSQVIQKIYVDVNEEGTEAAAATAMRMVYSSRGGGSPPKPIEMDVKRPFIFSIKHRATNSLLFLGAVTKL